jgi:hypothetical protein
MRPPAARPPGGAIADRPYQASHPALIAELLPDLVNIGVIQRVLQNLLRENLAILNLPLILEGIADFASLSKNPDDLVGAGAAPPRHVFRPGIRMPPGRGQGDHARPALRAMARGKIHRSPTEVALALDPATGRHLLEELSRRTAEHGAAEPAAVLVVSTEARLALRRFLEPSFPRLACSPSASCPGRPKSRTPASSRCRPPGPRRRRPSKPPPDHPPCPPARSTRSGHLLQIRRPCGGGGRRPHPRAPRPRRPRAVRAHGGGHGPARIWSGAAPGGDRADRSSGPGARAEAAPPLRPRAGAAAPARLPGPNLGRIARSLPRSCAARACPNRLGPPASAPDWPAGGRPAAPRAGRGRPAFAAATPSSARARRSPGPPFSARRRRPHHGAVQMARERRSSAGPARARRHRRVRSPQSARRAARLLRGAWACPWPAFPPRPGRPCRAASSISTCPGFRCGTRRTTRRSPISSPASRSSSGSSSSTPPTTTRAAGRVRRRPGPGGDPPRLHPSGRGAPMGPPLGLPARRRARAALPRDRAVADRRLRGGRLRGPGPPDAGPAAAPAAAGGPESEPAKPRRGAPPRHEIHLSCRAAPDGIPHRPIAGLGRPTRPDRILLRRDGRLPRRRLPFPLVLVRVLRGIRDTYLARQRADRRRNRHPASRRPQERPPTSLISLP